MVRQADLNDLDNLIELAKLLNPIWNKNMLVDVLKSSNADIYISVDNEIIKGFICVENVLDEGCVSAVAVHKDFRRNGIANKLLQVAITNSKMKTLYLEVEEDNFAGINLYTKSGFAKVGLRKNYYGKKSAIILQKEL